MCCKRVAVAAAVGSVVYAVGPCVIGRDQQTARERTLQRERQCVIGTVADVASPGDLREGRVRTQAGERIYNVNVGELEQIGAFAAYI